MRLVLIVKLKSLSGQLGESEEEGVALSDVLEEGSAAQLAHSCAVSLGSQGVLRPAGVGHGTNGVSCPFINSTIAVASQETYMMHGGALSSWGRTSFDNYVTHVTGQLQAVLTLPQTEGWRSFFSVILLSFVIRKSVCCWLRSCAGLFVSCC